MSATDQLIQQALIDNRSHLESDIGFEAISRAARLVLFQGLNDELDRQSDRWKTGDSAMQSLGFDPGVGQIGLDHVLPEHLHEGPHESLLTAPVTSFPNVCITAYLSSPSGEQFDQYDTSDVTMSLESFVIAGPVADGHQIAFETLVHGKIMRTTEAVKRTIAMSGTLMNTVLPIQLPPTVGLTRASWLRSEKDGQGAGYLIQGSRVQYTMQRNHSSF
jgi:hypothetical protein